LVQGLIVTLDWDRSERGSERGEERVIKHRKWYLTGFSRSFITPTPTCLSFAPLILHPIRTNCRGEDEVDVVPGVGPIEAGNETER